MPDDDEPDDVDLDLDLDGDEPDDELEGDDDGSPGWGGGDVAIGVAVGIAGSIVTSLVAFTASGHAPWFPGPGQNVGLAVGRQLTGAAATVYETAANLPIAWQMLQNLGLWVGLIAVTVYAVRAKGSGSLRTDLGLEVRPSDVPIGLVIGAALQIVLVSLLLGPLFRDVLGLDLGASARSVGERSEGPLGVVVLFVVVVLIAPVVEELFYRGLAQRSFQRRLGPRWGVVAAAVLFAAMHLQSVEFLALLLLGGACGALAERYGRLGLAIFTHMGFNLVTAVALTVQLGLL